jgi:hypothetical protein
MAGVVFAWNLFLFVRDATLKSNFYSAEFHVNRTIEKPMFTRVYGGAILIVWGSTPFT